MSILDTLRAKLRGGQDDEYYDDEYYGDEGYDEVDGASPRSYDDRAQQGASNRLLGNPDQRQRAFLCIRALASQSALIQPLLTILSRICVRALLRMHLVRSLPDTLLLTSIL